jgi:outer membrane lipoprotein-sorting protein
MRRRRLAVFFSFEILLNIALAQSTPTASYLLGKVHDTYGKLNEYKLVARVAYRDPEEGLNLSGFATVAVRKPDKIRWNVKGTVAQFFTGAAFDTFNVINGNTAWTYVPKLKQYKKENDPEVSDAIKHVEEMFLDYGSFNNMSDRARVLREDKLSFNGTVVSCYVVEIRDGPIDIYRLFIDGKRFFVLREDKESKNDPSAQYYTLSTAFSTIELRGPIDEQLFVFSPPADARLVKEIEP